MKFSGSVEFNAPRERVWAFLMDPNEVGPCGPGVESTAELALTLMLAAERRLPLIG